jgi:hypothetical protein
LSIHTSTTRVELFRDIDTLSCQDNILRDILGGGQPTSYDESSSSSPTEHAVQPFGQNDNLAAALLAATSLSLRLVRPEAAASGVW